MSTDRGSPLPGMVPDQPKPKPFLALGDVIKRVESNNDPYAMRFEVITYHRMMRKAPQAPVVGVIRDAHHGCTAQTACMIAATSWGAWQLMGFNVYSSGRYQRTIGEFLGSLADQNLTAGYFLDKIGYRPDMNFASIDVDNFAKLYNGAGNIDAYARRLRNAAFDLSKGAIGALI
jgi:hypothetical protein